MQKAMVINSHCLKPISQQKSLLNSPLCLIQDLAEDYILFITVIIFPFIHLFNSFLHKSTDVVIGVVNDGSAILSEVTLFGVVGVLLCRHEPSFTF